MLRSESGRMRSVQFCADWGVACALNANTGLSANHAGPSVLIEKDATVFSIGSMNSEVLVLNDQGGGIMSVSDKPSTLRAQMKHHEPIICFEPGIAKREGGIIGS